MQSEGTYKVAVFINSDNEFSVTMRSNESDYRQMVREQKERGFDTTLIQQGLSVDTAMALKLTTVKQYETEGYKCVTRPPRNKKPK